MNFNFFFDFLHCLYIEEVEVATRTNDRERRAIMVLSEELSDNVTSNELSEYNKRQVQRWTYNKWRTDMPDKIVMQIFH